MLAAGSYDRAVADLQGALALEPDHADALLQLGTAYEKLGALQQAYDTLSALIHIDPNNAKALYARGACLNLMGQDARALGIPGFICHSPMYCCMCHSLEMFPILSRYHYGTLWQIDIHAACHGLRQWVAGLLRRWILNSGVPCARSSALRRMCILMQRIMSLLWRRTRCRSGFSSGALTKLRGALCTALLQKQALPVLWPSVRCVPSACQAFPQPCSIEPS